MSDTIFGRYHGKSGALFGLFIKTSLLTILTLGIYRFWAKTRIRKYFWSATTGDGDSFEYTGTGLEKFLGFLIAVVVLAIYLGIVQMVLMFFGIFLFDEPQTEAEVLLQVFGVYITFFAVIPLIFFAQYRSRRYKLARSRWRGLRFGMDSAAGGYVWRAILHTLVTILTLGILLPRQTFYLEKYMSDRMWYGDAQFEQMGRWQALFKGMKHLVIALVIIVVSIVLGVWLDMPGVAAAGFFVGYVWFIVGSIYYRVYAFNYMTENKLLDAAVQFKASASTKKVVQIVLVGMLLIVLVMFAAGVVVSLVALGMSSTFSSMFMPQAGSTPPSAGAFASLAVVGIVLYVGLLLAISGMSLVLITQKVIAHVIDSVIVDNASHLETIRQRAADKGADADGFADALDIGGAI